MADIDIKNTDTVDTVIADIFLNTFRWYATVYIECGYGFYVL